MFEHYSRTIRHYMNGILTGEETVQELQFLVLSYFEQRKISMTKARTLLIAICKWSCGILTIDELTSVF